eukprot:CAMPEP_0185724440 /NCGR_PEP_ID=MMETSP1171-20130828/921_1 /TAXON_ID=374046 /ORGANISM="Helicotheca tamensis, Strain CCMP826" /LENGTH=787 /DNA_ID=CAMNT_0028392291 /DNA_START=15 /DNA_END=2378 /DNA_ORIENTATION=+
MKFTNSIKTFTPPFFIVAAIVTATTVSAGSTVVPVAIGPEWQIPFGKSSLGRGFKLNVDETENPFRDIVFEGEVEALPFQTSYARSEIIKRSDELQRMMGIEGRLAVSYGPMISGEGAGRFLENMVSSKKSVSVVYSSRNTAYAKSLVHSSLVQHQDIDDLDSNGIAEVVGTKFIDQIIYGSQLDIIFTVTATKEIDLQEIEAELKGKIGVGPFSLEFSAKFERSEGEERAELELLIDVRAVGVTHHIPGNPTFDQVNQIIIDFGEEYKNLLDELGEHGTIDEEQHVLKQLSPVGFTLSSIADYKDELNKFEAAQLDSRMEDLTDRCWDAFLLKSELKKSLDEAEQTYCDDPRLCEEEFVPYYEVVQDYVSRLSDKIDECVEFRSLPIASIVGANAEPLPEPFVNENTWSVLRGLVGEAYIASPLELEGESFDGMHYVGFALPGINLLRPWLSGTARLDSDNTIVASADTSKTLLQRIKKYVESDRICSGQSSQTDWKVYAHNSIYIDVDTSQCGFADTPVYVTSLSGTGNHFAITGISSVYHPKSTGFRIYLRANDGATFNLNPDFAQKRNYQVQWTASMVPITRPPVQNRGICSGKSSEYQWKHYSEGSLYVDVDTSGCGYSETPNYITSLSGTSTHFVLTGTTAVYHPTKSGFRMYIRGSTDGARKKLTTDFARDKKYQVNWIASPSVADANVCSGHSSQYEWKVYGKNSIYTDVATSKCGFLTTPNIVASVSGASHHFTFTGTSALYNLTPEGFRIYLLRSEPLKTSAAEAHDYEVQWIASAQ